MITKKQIILFILALLAIVIFVIIGFRTSATPGQEPTPVAVSPDGSVLWPSHEVERVVVDTSAQPHGKVTAEYPKTTSDTITLYFKNFVEQQISQFTEDTSWADDYDNAESEILSLDISYTSTQATTAQTYVFTVNSYTGGAHGMQFRKTFSFTEDGQMLTLSNLFNKGAGGLTTFSSLVQKELLKRPTADREWIADGAGATEENYASFIITDTGITVLFDPYQVAPWSDGAIDIAIPATSFSSIANPDIFPRPTQ